MGRLAIFLVVVVTTVGSTLAAAGEPDDPKLFARCVDASALVFGPTGTKEPAPLAGALVLDRDKRLVLAPQANLPDAPTVLFPAYTAKGELRNRAADYADMWKREDRWQGKVLQRDKDRDLAVIELDRALPERARPAQFAERSVPVGADVYALARLAPDRDLAWGLAEGKVRAVGTERFIGRDPPGRVPKIKVTSTAPSGAALECGLFDSAGRVVGFPEPPLTRAQLVTSRLDVTEIRAFLTENKVTFQSAPDDPGAKVRKAK